MVYIPKEDSYLILEVIKALNLKNKRVLDMGTGTGILAIEAYLKGAYVDAVDINKEALEYATKQYNKLRRSILKKTKNKGTIRFFWSDLFSKIDKNKKYDYIFFNAPYLPSGGRKFDVIRRNEKELDLDIDTIGGKYGYELLVKFIKSLNYYLKKDGKCFIVYSSLSKPEKIKEAASSCLLSLKEIKKKHVFFEDIIVASLERNLLNKRLLNKGFNVIDLIGEGKHALVYRALTQKKEVAIKVAKPGFEKNIRKESKIIELLTKTNAFFSPNFITSGSNFLVEELLHGKLLKDFMQNPDKKNKKEKDLIIFLYMLISRQLDIRGVKKEEMHRPQKHLIINPEHNRIWLIDYERGNFMNFPSNFTQAMQFIMKGYKNKKPSSKFLNLLKAYKSARSELYRETLFAKIVDALDYSLFYKIAKLEKKPANRLHKKLLKYIFYNLSLKELDFLRGIVKLVKQDILTYKHISKELNTSPRVVGKILSKNPLLVAVPCHKVIGTKDIGGYILGKEKKKLLLNEEQKIIKDK